MIVGDGDSASLSTLGKYPDQATCATAQKGVTAALGEGQGTRVFCVSSDAMEGISKAAHAGQ